MSGLAGGRRITGFVALVAVAFCSDSAARGADGTLANIVQPNNGKPAAVVPGGTFDATLLRKSVLELRNGTARFPLDPEWSGLPDGHVRARCRVPESVPAGIYALVSGDAEGADENARAVFVYASIPDRYTIAHVSDLRIGSPDHWSSSVSIAQRAFEEIAESGAALVLVTGDLTENGSDAEFQNLLRALDACALPTYVSPGKRDRGFGRFFGASSYTAGFGADAYLSVDASASENAFDTENRHGLLRQLRREIKPARWSIGFSHRPPNAIDPRTQLILLADSPLDLMITGQALEPSEGDDLLIHRRGWLIRTAGVLSGVYRLLDVTPARTSPRTPEVFRTAQ